jgi:hypothetical protein
MPVLLVILAACAAPVGDMQLLRTEHFQVRFAYKQVEANRSQALVDIKDADGKPLIPDSVLVSASMPSMGHSIPDAVAARDALGRYVADISQANMKGDWELEVRVTRAATTDAARFKVTVK